MTRTSLISSLSNGLLAWYRMGGPEDDIGVHHDYTGNARDLSGNMGQAVGVDGFTASASYVANGDPGPTTTAITFGPYTAYTLSCWVKTIEFAPDGGQVFAVNFIDGSVGISVDENAIGFYYGEGNRETKAFVNDEAWHHLVMTTNTTTTKCYIDGIYQGTVHALQGPNVEVATRIIAADFVTSTQLLIQNCGIWNRVLADGVAIDVGQPVDPNSEIGWLWNGGESFDPTFDPANLAFVEFPADNTTGVYVLNQSPIDEAGRKLNRDLKNLSAYASMFLPLSGGTLTGQLNTLEDIHTSGIAGISGTPLSIFAFNGQDVYVSSGSSSVGQAGIANFLGGSSAAGIQGGEIQIRGGSGGTASVGGLVTVQGGPAGAGNTTGGPVVVTGGLSSGTGAGGSVTMTGGQALGAGAGGTLTLRGGRSETGGTTGNAVLDAGEISGGATPGKVKIGSAYANTIEIGKTQGVNELAPIRGFYISAANVAVAVPSIADLANGTDIQEVDVNVSSMTFQPVFGDAVIALQQEALPTNCRLMSAQVTATDTVRLVFASNGGNVVGASKNFKFFFIDLT